MPAQVTIILSTKRTCRGPVRSFSVPFPPLVSPGCQRMHSYALPSVLQGLSLFIWGFFASVAVAGASSPAPEEIDDGSSLFCYLFPFFFRCVTSNVPPISGVLRKNVSFFSFRNCVDLRSCGVLKDTTISCP